MNHACREYVYEILEGAKDTPSESLESECLEFKAYKDEKSLHNSKELAEEISALANKNGGIVIIGVKDSSDVQHGDWESQLSGFPIIDIDETRERIRGKIDPQIDITLSNIPFEGKNYLAISIPHRPDTLFSTRSGKTCIRDGKSSRPMTTHEIRDAVSNLSSYDWTAEIPPKCDTKSIDGRALQDAITDFKERRGITEEVDPDSYLEAVGATINGTLTNGGLLFLGKPDEIRKHLGDYEYRFSWKKPNGELAVNDVWEDCIWNSIKRVKKHFSDCNETRHFKGDDYDFSVPLMDEVAFHEAYLNAVTHRDYSKEGMVSVTYTGKELKITSPGLFFGGVTEDNIGRHEPRHRNKLLARILMSHNLVDRAGMGVVRMGLRSLMYGRAFPRFKEHSDSIEVTLEASYLRPPIAALTLENTNEWGVPELFILNSVYETPAVPIDTIEKTLSKISDSPWDLLLEAIDNLEQVELCGTKQGIFIKPKQSWRNFLKVTKSFRTPTTNEKHVDLYKYLKKHGEASNSDLTELLGYNHSSQTSKFLREAEYVVRKGSAANARWYIKDQSALGARSST